MKRKVEIYDMSINCFYDGSVTGGEFLILDNENALSNIKEILHRYIEYKVASIDEELDDEYYRDVWDIIQETIDEVGELRGIVDVADSVSSLKSISLVGSDVLHLNKVKVYE